MEPQLTASVYSTDSVPRLRVTRRPSHTLGSSAPPSLASTGLKHTLTSPDSQTTSEEESGTLELVETTPRLLSASLPPPDSTFGSSDTTHRLRAVIDRFDTPSRTSTPGSRGVMPPTPSEPDSDLDVPAGQAARASIRVLLQNALREPGGTPQKPKLTRRASFNVVGSPPVSKSRRKSTSDEENEVSARRHEGRRSEVSTAASLDRLRLQLTEAMPSRGTSSTSRPTSEAAGGHLSPPSARLRTTSDHLHSMTHKSTGRVSPNGRINAMPQGTSASDTRHHKKSTLRSEGDSADVKSEDGRSSRGTSASSEAEYRDRLKEAAHEREHDLERAWNRPQTSRPHLTPHTHTHGSKADHGIPAARPHSRLSHGAPRTVSPPSTTHSHPHREELREEHKRGRNWNASHPTRGQHPHQGSRATSPLPTSASNPSEIKAHHRTSPSYHERTHLHLNDGPSYDHSRASSPSSSTSSRSHQDEEVEELYERERNWNAPRPKWDQHHHTRHPSLRLDKDHVPHPNSSRNSVFVEKQEEQNRHHMNYSLNNGHVLRPVSPIPHSQPPSSNGHRRSILELSNVLDPLPSKNGLQSPLANHDQESDGSLFADESIPPPQMSTPTFKKNNLSDFSLSPAASDTPLPPSPSSPPASTRDPSVRAESDLARLQRAVAPDSTFPASHPSPPETPTLSTPPRRSSPVQDVAFKTPSPPPGLPDLPDPPSSDEETRTRVKGLPGGSLSTPYCPGAFRTPSPVPTLDRSGKDDVSSDSMTEIVSEPEPVNSVSHTQTQTPGNEYLRGMSDSISIPVTPAPPGAYGATPAQSKPKGILKVRFDSTSPNSEDIPPLTPSPSRRKGLRLVDEYGRERRFTEDGEEIILDSRRKSNKRNDSQTDPTEWKPPPVDDMTMTPRRRAKIRQVDALGNVCMEEQKQQKGETRGSKKDVFSHLTRSLSEVGNDLAEQEEALAASIPQNAPRGDERLAGLASVSKAARIERTKIVRKLQLERYPEDGTGKVFLARHLPDLQSSLEISPPTSWLRRRWRLTLVLVSLEFIVLFVGYRLAYTHAKEAWLTTHFDPFFPALYLRQSPPSFISPFGTLPVGWSAFAISGAVRQVGLRSFVEDVGKWLWEVLWSWRMASWETWGSPAAGPPVPQPWPPS